MTDSNNKRLISIDILRGIIIVLMALDHARDFFGATPFGATDLEHTNGWLFFTRWLTHFCAPLFVFLTGVSAFLYYQKVQSKALLRNFLFTRGLWLLVVELVIMNLSWQFDYTFTFVQVIWILGWSMIILSGMIYLPSQVILLVSLAFILFHNGLDDHGIQLWLGEQGWLWNLLHLGGMITINDGSWRVLVIYPLIPWFAVMALGYWVGHWYLLLADTRQARLLGFGLGCWVLFVVLRFGGWYGDPSPWPQAANFGHEVLSFLNTQKYPPSLLFLLMTLGPGMVLLALLERINQQSDYYPYVAWLGVFGSVPLFVYIIHVLALNLANHIYTNWVYGRTIIFPLGNTAFPDNYQPSLLLAYGVWLVLLLVLYLPSKHYAQLKKRSNNPLLSYL